MSDGAKTSYRAAIFTAIQLEYQAVCAHLTNLREEEKEESELKTLCERGEFSENNRKWDVMVVETGAGTTQAAAKTMHILERFRPQVAIFVGIAGGIKDVGFGDVVVASKVYSYESGRADPVFRSRPETYHPTLRILRRASVIARKNTWLERLKEDLSGLNEIPKAIVAPIASGNLVVASIDAEVLQLVRSHFNDAAAIEMEGFGFLEAARLYQEIEALIIRGISDLIKDKSKTDQQQFQPLAAKRASAFAFEVLATLKIQLPDRTNPPLGNDPLSPPELKEFNKSLPDYINEVKKIRDFLNQRTGFSTEHYKNAFKRLNDIETHVKRLLDAESPTHMRRRALLAAMQTRIHDLKPALAFIQLEQARGNAYSHAIALCDTLLRDLEQWLRQPQ